MIKYYVDVIKGLDTNDGLSQSKPFKTLQALLNSKTSFTENSTIYLNEGTYTCNATLVKKIPAGVKVTVYGLGGKTSIQPTEAFGFNNNEIGVSGATLEFNKLILDFTYMVQGNNHQYMLNDFNLNNVAIININRGTPYSSFYPTNSAVYTFKNCIAIGNADLALRCDGGSIHLHNCYGRFGNGWITTQSQWDIENNVITTAPQVDAEYKITDTNVSSNVGLYEGEYEWKNLTYLIKMNNEYYSILRKFIDEETTMFKPLDDMDFSQGFMLYDLCSIDKIIDVAPIMTSDTTPAPYKVEASSVYNTIANSAWKAFSGASIVDGWFTTSGVKTGWIKIDLAQITKINRFNIYCNNTTNAILMMPKDFNLLGSNDDINYSVIKEFTNVVSNMGVNEFVLDEDVEYRYYKLDIFSNNGGGYTGFLEWRLIYNVPIEKQFRPIDKFDNFSIVTKESFDNNVKIKGMKSNSELIIASGDINLSIADNIDYFKILQTQLNNGDIKIILSIDGGVTWKTYNEIDGFININSIIPVKHYNELTIEDEGNIELAKEEILQTGISIDVFNTLDFNTLNSETVRFAYVIHRPKYEDNAEVSQLDWRFDAKGWMEEMQDSEGDFFSYDYSTRFKSNVNNEMIKLTAML